MTEAQNARARSAGFCASKTHDGFCSVVATTCRLPHRRKISPEGFEARRAAKEGGEIRGIHQNDVPSHTLVRRNPQQAVELALARFGERMRACEVDRLSCEHLDGTCPSRQFVVRQMRVEVEGGDVPQEAKAIEVVERCQRSNFVCVFHERGSKAESVMDRNVETLHQRARVLPKPLLARYERIAMVQIFHLALLHVAGEADVMMRREQKTGAVPIQPFSDRGDLLR